MMKDYGNHLKTIVETLPNDQLLKELVVLVLELIEVNKELRLENQQLRLENQQLKAEVRQLKNEVQLLNDEIAVLKNQPPRPKITPSNLEKPATTKDRKANWTKGSKKLIIDRTENIEIPFKEIPLNAKFKGYKNYVVQELIIKKETVRYRLAQWQTIDGKYIFAKLPTAIGSGHFGPRLRQYIVHQHNANRVPQNRIQSDLLDKGIFISSGQIDEILQSTAKRLLNEKEQILAAGLKAKYIQGDDTGGRHKGTNGFTTVICNDFFAYFKSSFRKSRINFLEILCQGNIGYIISQEALDYIKFFNVAPAIFSCMERQLGSRFTCKADWDAFLKENMFGKTTCRIITEATLLGAILSRDTLSLETIFLTDGAGQFDLFKHALCWIHIERSIKRIIPINEQDRQERDTILDEFWNFYRELKEYKNAPSEEARLILEKRFDKIFLFRATEIPLTKALKKIFDSKQQLLLVLEHPNIPLHNNRSEGDIREFVTKRKVSGGTRSDSGREARDTCISLYKTCKKLSISFWAYLEDRLHGTDKIKPLAEIIKERMRAACPGPSS